MLIITGTAISKNTPVTCLNCSEPLDCQICTEEKQSRENDKE